MRRSATILAPVLFAIPLAACGGGDDQPPADDEHYDCTTETRADTFAVGLEHVTPAGVHFIVQSGTPTPPSRGDNDIVMQIEDATAAPMTGQQLTVKPWMPDHGHGTAVPVIVTESTTTPGQYDLSQINFHMPGLWQLIISNGLPAAPEHTATFAFCIPG
jgi:hypothetical protein